MTSAPAHRSWKSFCHALFNRESFWLVWKDTLRGTMTKSDLSVAFTHRGHDIDKTGEGSRGGGYSGHGCHRGGGENLSLFFLYDDFKSVYKWQKITIITCAFNYVLKYVGFLIWHLNHSRKYMNKKWQKWQNTKHNRGSQSTEKKWGNTTKQDQKREQQYTKHDKT